MSDSSLCIVAVYAHPDDGEFHAAGSLAKWAAAGHRVHAICATDGALGTRRPGPTPAELTATRATELAAALSVNVALVYSAALCTGLARLQGSTARLTGPFSF